MAISARNQLPVTVKSIQSGAVNDVIELSLSSGETLVAVITADSTKKLTLSEGKSAVAVFKAPNVMLATDSDLILSARNQLKATVTKITHGAVNAEVVVQTAGGVELVAMITEESAKRLALDEKASVTAIIKASHILVGVKK